MIALVHLLLLWVLAGLIGALPVTVGHSTEFQVAVLMLPRAAAHAEAAPAPALALPIAPDDVQPPTIAIDNTTHAASSDNGLGIILPPAPDPAFPNPTPKLPASFVHGGSFETALTVLVDEHGFVSDTRLLRSSGQQALDEFAAAFVKAHWRFRAALRDGRYVSDWTTVLIRFASSD